MKRQKDMTPEDETPPGHKVSNMLLGMNRGQLLIVPERMNGWAKADMTPSCGCVW